VRPAPSVAVLLRAGREQLAKAGIESPALDARLLLAAASGLSPAGLVSAGDEPLPMTVAAAYEAFLARRAAGEPVARIRGFQEFWGLDFALSPDTLVPRPDTETLVEAALAALPPGRPLRLLDIGTGTGAILAAVLSERPLAWGAGSDLAAGALATARGNLARLGLASRAGFVRARWLDGFAGPFDAILSNPPYVAEKTLATLAPEVRRHDPRLALAGGADGLDAYRVIVPEALPRLVPGGLLALEIGADQGEAVAALARVAGYAKVRIAQDLAGRDRVVLATSPVQRDEIAAFS